MGITDFFIGISNLTLIEKISISINCIIGLFILIRLLNAIFKYHGAGDHSMLVKGDNILVNPNTERLESRFPQYIRNKQGLWLYRYEWIVPKPIGIIFLVHGIGEHMGRYPHVARFYNENNFNVYGIDHQGHGRSLGDRVYINDFQDFVDDFVQYVKYLLDSNVFPADMPRFLLGHSMGGLISLKIAQQNPDLFTGIIASGPALRPPVGKIKQIVVKVMGKIMPHYPITNLNSDKMAHDKVFLALCAEDPLYPKDGLKPKILDLMFEAQREILATCNTNCTFPFLIIQGSDDIVCPIEGSQEFYAKAPSKDKLIRFYEGEYHTILNEVNYLKHVNDILLWMHERMK